MEVVGGVGRERGSDRPRCKVREINGEIEGE